MTIANSSAAHASQNFARDIHGLPMYHCGPDPRMGLPKRNEFKTHTNPIGEHSSKLRGPPGSALPYPVDMPISHMPAHGRTFSLLRYAPLGIGKRTSS